MLPPKFGQSTEISEDLQVGLDEVGRGIIEYYTGITIQVVYKWDYVELPEAW